jgi:hypothetical protein
MVATPAAAKPEGGFCFIAVEQLCLAWWAYCQRLIPLVDLYVWFAAHELVARRCLLGPGQQAYYTYDELRGLVGGGRSVKASLQRLTTAGLLTWTPERITFPDRLPDAQACPGLWAMLGQIRNHRRLVPFPRRLLRLIAGGCRSVVIATILGHLFRCLYYRQGECRPTGLCKASWIAEVFGISLRSVKAARKYLVEDLHLLLPVEVPHWVRNHYGQKITINLQWALPVVETVVQPSIVEISADDAVHEIAPLPAANLHEFAPPDSYRETLTEEKHQKPAAGGPAGVLTTLFVEARESLRNGTALLDERSPVVGARCPQWNGTLDKVTLYIFPHVANELWNTFHHGAVVMMPIRIEFFPRHSGFTRCADDVLYHSGSSQRKLTDMINDHPGLIASQRGWGIGVCLQTKLTGVCHCERRQAIFVRKEIASSLPAPRIDRNLPDYRHTLSYALKP